MKNLLLIAGCLFALFVFSVWYLNDGFSLAKIQSDRTFSMEWEVRKAPLEAIHALLDQPFFYIGKGSQCYVFESEDKQLVLKFFRQDRYRLSKITEYFTCPAFLKDIQQQKKIVKEKKREALFRSCKIAYEDMQEETGLIYLHLNKSYDLKKSVVLHDKLKRSYPIRIDDYEFILQKHGEHIFPYLARLLEQGKKKAAQEALESLVALLSSRLQKGIIDHDPVIHKNSGFRNNQALFLDIGEFEKQTCDNPQEEILEATQQLRLWLQEKDQELASYLQGLLSRTNPKRS
jgi:hypothetical protein